MALVPHFVTSAGSDTWANSAVYTTPCSLSTAITNATAGDKVWILSGNYTRTASDAPANVGTVGSPVIYEGCTSFNTGTPTPITPTRAGGHGALDTTGMPVIAYNATYQMACASAAFVEFVHLNFTGAINGNFVGTTSSTNTISIIECVGTNSTSGTLAVCFYRAINTVNCDGFLTGATNSSYVYKLDGAVARCVNCQGTNSSSAGVGIFGMGASSALINPVCYASAGVGIDFIGTIGFLVVNPTIYSQAVAGIRTPNYALTGVPLIVNPMITDCAYAFLNLYNATAAHSIKVIKARTRDNTNADLGYGDNPHYYSILTDNGNYLTDYVSATDLSPAAAAVGRGAGLGGDDIGARQRVEGYPAAANLLDSATCDSGAVVGTYHAPDAGEVTSNAVFGPASGTSGTYHRPETNEVIDTASFGISSGQAGTIHQPDVIEVTDNAVFGAASAVHGTYHRPEAAEVIDTAVFGPASGTPGTVHQPDQAEVISTAVYGPASATPGTYPTTAVSKAAQLATDIAAVEAEAEHIELGTTILTVPGELDIGSIDLTPKAGVVGPDYVLMGHENYTDGEDGTYVPTTPETTKKDEHFGANGAEVGTFDGSTSAETTANGWFNCEGSAASDEWKLNINAASWDSLVLYPEKRVEIPVMGFSLAGSNILPDIRSSVLIFPESGRFMVARIHASNYPVVLSLNNGSGAVTQNITDSQDVLILTPGTPAREWTLDITGANEIYSVMLAGETAALVQDGFVGLSRVDSPPTWLCRQIYSPVPVAFSCARVVSRSASPALVFKIYRENSTTASGTTGWTSSTLTNCNAFRLPRLEPSRFWRVDISGADSSDIVDEVRLATSMERLK